MSKVSPAAYQELASRAHQAGAAAAASHTPTPMAVTERANPLDDNSRLVSRYVVPAGVCGFAWVKIPGNTGFARWAKKAGLSRPAYGGGHKIWVSDYGQSMERKYAYASAYAAVLREAGINAYAYSRMD